MGFFDNIFGGSGGGGILGALGGSEKVAGRKPNPWVPYTPNQIMQEYLDLTSKSQGQREELASAANRFNQGQLFNLFDEAAEGSRELRTKDLANIRSDVYGELTPEETSNIDRSIAAWAVDSGTGGTSPFASAKRARDYGLTTRGLQIKGGQRLNDFIENTRRFYIPRQVSSLDYQMAVPQYDPYWVDKAQEYNNKLAAAPDPGAVLAAASQQALLESVLGIYSGAPKSALTNPAGYGGLPMAPTPSYYNPSYGTGRGSPYFDSQSFGAPQGAFEGTGEGGSSGIFGYVLP